MAAVKYSNINLWLGETAASPLVPATNLSIQYQNQLQPGRILASSPNRDMRIGGPLSAKISFSFPVFRDFDYGEVLPELMSLTGETVRNLNIYDGEFQLAFNSSLLSSLSIEIQPFVPVMASAEFIVYNPPKNVSFPNFTNSAGGSPQTSTFAYGHNVLINGGSTLSDSSRDSISYKVTCNRTPVYSIGSINATNVFLDSVEKEVSIRSTNIGKFIDYTGYGESFTIDLRDEVPSSILSFGLSSKSRIVSQNLTAQEGDILAGEVTLREVVL